MNMKKTLIVFASLLLLSGACWSDDLETNANEAKYYDNAKVVRIKSVEGEGYVQRSYDEGKEEATVNLPLFEKDVLGTTDGRLAVYLGRLNYLRLDADTVVVLEKVPALRQTDLAIRLEEGSVYLEIENLDREKGIEIQTADCGIFLLDKGVYRVNSGSNGQTEVVVLEGIAEVAGSDSSSNVRENQKIVMKRGQMTERPFYFYAADKDDFDRWNKEQNRDLGYARYGTSRYLQSGYEDTEYEMSRAGRWVYMSDFSSYVWRPHYAGADWRPYANGRWVWNPYYGYVWTSYDTCGWFTHHYGRWNWSYSSGWYWIPSYHWSPAWVSWCWNDHYYGWSPLSWWNRPVVIINNHWDRNYDYHRGIPRHSRSTIIIRKNELSAANIHRVALNKATLGQVNGDTIAYRGSAPSLRPELNKVTVINARGRQVTYKQGAVVSAEKYRAQGSDIHNSVYKYNAAPGSRETIRPAVKDDTEFRSRTDGGSSSRTRYTSGSGNSSSSGGSTSTSSYRSKSDDSGNTGSSSGNYRSKSDDSGNTGSSSGSSSSDSYRSRSGSSSSSSSSSSNSGSTARKKKKGEPSYLSYSSGGGSGSVSGTQASVPRYQSRSTSTDASPYSSRDGASRRFIDSVVSSGRGSSSYRSRYESDNASPANSGATSSSSRASRSRSTGSSGNSPYVSASGSHSSSGSSSSSGGSYSGSTSRSSGSSSRARSSSSSSSGSSGGSRARKK